MITYLLYESNSAGSIIAGMGLALIFGCIMGAAYANESDRPLLAFIVPMVFMPLLPLLFIAGMDMPPTKTVQLTWSELEPVMLSRPEEGIPWEQTFPCDDGWSVGIIMNDRSAIFRTDGLQIAWEKEKYPEIEKCLNKYRRIF